MDDQNILNQKVNGPEVKTEVVIKDLPTNIILSPGARVFMNFGRSFFNLFGSRGSPFGGFFINPSSASLNGW